MVGLDASLEPREFDVAYQTAEKARKDFEHARQQLKAHVATHGCQQDDSSK